MSLAYLFPFKILLNFFTFHFSWNAHEKTLKLKYFTKSSTKKSINPKNPQSWSLCLSLPTVLALTIQGPRAGLKVLPKLSDLRALSHTTPHAPSGTP